MEELEKRVQALEEVSHSDHTINSDVIAKICDLAVQRVIDHFKMLFRIGVAIKDKEEQ